MDKHIIYLPQCIKEKILSYIYFTKEVGEKMIVINKMILYYDHYLFQEIRKVFLNRVLILYYRITTFIKNNLILMKKINNKMSPFLKSVYPDSKFDNQTFEHVRKLFHCMNIIEKQKAYTFIMNF